MKRDRIIFIILRYQLKDSSEYIFVATTRPETLFGDSAICINPNDERYKNLRGKKVILPILNREIPGNRR